MVTDGVADAYEQGWEQVAVAAFHAVGRTGESSRKMASSCEEASAAAGFFSELARRSRYVSAWLNPFCAAGGASVWYSGWPAGLDAEAPDVEFTEGDGADAVGTWSFDGSGA